MNPGGMRNVFKVNSAAWRDLSSDSTRPEKQENKDRSCTPLTGPTRGPFALSMAADQSESFPVFAAAASFFSVFFPS
jgi:hypothetical protein